MLYERQKHLLVLLEAGGGHLGALDFQKLLFLYCQQAQANPPYDFVPYGLGGFSFTSYADKRKLIERGFLENDENRWRLTARGRQIIQGLQPLRAAAAQFMRQYAGVRGEALVAHTYRQHPWSATRSEIAARVLAGEAAALDAIAAARPIAGAPGIVTIGYEGLSLEGYLNQLLRHGVTLLCDVRRNPISRKYGFSKNTLARSCEALGVRYEHMPELGIASDERRDLRTQADYEALFAMYERRDMPRQTAALARIQSWVNAGERVALTCYEHLPRQCHRHRVAEALERAFGAMFTPTHL